VNDERQHTSLGTMVLELVWRTMQE